MLLSFAIRYTTPNQREISRSSCSSEIDYLRKFISSYLLAAYHSGYTSRYNLNASDFEVLTYGPRSGICKETSLILKLLFPKGPNRPFTPSIMAVRNIGNNYPHAFLIATSTQTDKRYLVDATYQQFIAVDNCPLLDQPSAMIIELDNRENVQIWLKNYGIPEKWHDYYLDLAFPQDGEIENFDYLYATAVALGYIGEGTEYDDSEAAIKYFLSTIQKEFPDIPQEELPNILLAKFINECKYYTVDITTIIDKAEQDRVESFARSRIREKHPNKLGQFFQISPREFGVPSLT